MIPITSWAEDDRPREKLASKGAGSLSDAELIAILIGSGNREETAVELSKRILNSAKNNLVELSRYQIPDFLGKFKGIGDAKAITIIAALELGKRIRSSEALEKPSITNSHDSFQILSENLCFRSYEEFWIILVNQSNKYIKKMCISEGGLSFSAVCTKKMFAVAIEYKATGIILAHNHPSGNLKPSTEDISLTKKLIEAGKILDIRILDHLIIGDNDYLSFADQGLLE